MHCHERAREGPRSWRVKIGDRDLAAAPRRVSVGPGKGLRGTWDRVSALLPVLAACFAEARGHSKTEAPCPVGTGRHWAGRAGGCAERKAEASRRAGVGRDLWRPHLAARQSSKRTGVWSSAAASVCQRPSDSYVILLDAAGGRGRHTSVIRWVCAPA